MGEGGQDGQQPQQPPQDDTDKSDIAGVVVPRGSDPDVDAPAATFRFFTQTNHVDSTTRKVTPGADVYTPFQFQETPSVTRDPHTPPGTPAAIIGAPGGIPDPTKSYELYGELRDQTGPGNQVNVAFHRDDESPSAQGLITPDRMSMTIGPIPDEPPRQEPHPPLSMEDLAGLPHQPLTLREGEDVAASLEPRFTVGQPPPIEGTKEEGVILSDPFKPDEEGYPEDFGYPDHIDTKVRKPPDKVNQGLPQPPTPPEDDGGTPPPAPGAA